ncbi:Gfo/Idh/MocA family protein [Petroclostridium xylanilyticum]|uniref:Gfo/Idh/MocA family protein n=1 Tax=Petroclostridium xylanilyticum TaxID=1792311 RepID=UPI000B98C1C0|nr:Gfo/Idh/MocA family oxidoreductase [Petroclostridium xylanilyticum]
MSKVKIALIGAGQRGKDVYGDYALRNPQEVQFVAVAEPDDEKRTIFAANHEINGEFQFKSWEELLNRPQFCDAVIIAVQDRMHYEPALLALRQGYHVLLEKPMATDPFQCIQLGKAAQEYKRIFMICHVLRYTPFFSTIKELIAQNKIGKIVSIQYNENIGFWHFAHSFVRGNWRNSEESSPIILAKSCHDMDILLWLAGSDCEKISSFGELSYFKVENAPEGAGNRCIQGCKIEHECAFSAVKQYLGDNVDWPTSVISEDKSLKARINALKEGPYGRCVFKCDNNVTDHQVVIAEFKGGVTAAFTMCAFTPEISRTIKIMGTAGQIDGHMEKNEIIITHFASGRKEIIYPGKIYGRHAGGDTRLMKEFAALVSNNDGTQALTSADISVQSHLMAFAAEESRLSGKVINMQEYYTNISNQNRPE